MISKLFQRSLSRVAFRKNLLPCLFQKSAFSFNSTHKEQRQIEKEKEEKLISQISNLETVAQQDQFTEKELKGIISDRQEQLDVILNEKKLPIDAMLLGLTVTLPLLGGSGYLYYQLASGLAADSFIPLFNSFAKFVGIHQCFQSGVHWGFAVSQHDLQTDSINSSPQARRQFVLACLPAFAALANTVSLVYGVPTEGLLNMAPISVMAGTQLFILGLDMQAVNNRSAPKWYLNLKYILSFICFLSYGIYAGMYLNFGDKIKALKQAVSDPYRKYIPTNVELLKPK